MTWDLELENRLETWHWRIFNSSVSFCELFYHPNYNYYFFFIIFFSFTFYKVWPKILLKILTMWRWKRSCVRILAFGIIMMSIKKILCWNIQVGLERRKISISLLVSVPVLDSIAELTQQLWTMNTSWLPDMSSDWRHRQIMKWDKPFFFLSFPSSNFYVGCSRTFFYILNFQRIPRFLINIYSRSRLVLIVKYFIPINTHVQVRVTVASRQNMLQGSHGHGKVMENDWSWKSHGKVMENYWSWKSHGIQ